MLDFTILQQFIDNSDNKDFPALISEWELVDGAKSVHGLIFTLKNKQNGNEVSVLGWDNIMELNDYQIQFRAQGYKDLYYFLELLEDKFAKNRATQLAERLTPALVELIAELGLMPATEKNGNDPTEDVEFIKMIAKDGAREQSIRARLNSLFNYGTPAHKSIAEFCKNQTKAAMSKALAAKTMK